MGGRRGRWWSCCERGGKQWFHNGRLLLILLLLLLLLILLLIDRGRRPGAVPAGTHCGAAVAAGDAEGLQAAVPADVDARGRQVADTEGRMRGQKRTTSGG